jgi:lysozyme family protein
MRRKNFLLMTTNEKIGVGVAALVVAALARRTVKKITDKMSFEFLLPFVLKWEAKWKKTDIAPYFFVLIDGAWGIDPNDHGGETKWGIAKKYYPNLDIKNLTLADATKIYERDYWKRYNCERVPKHLRYLFFDCTVNQGGGFSTRTLQKLAGVNQDGVIGIITETAAQSVTVSAYCNARRQRYLDIIKADATQQKFKDGWMNRIADAENIQNRLNNLQA